jgi:hypothetical protein
MTVGNGGVAAAQSQGLHGMRKNAGATKDSAEYQRVAADMALVRQGLGKDSTDAAQLPGSVEASSRGKLLACMDVSG